MQTYDVALGQPIFPCDQNKKPLTPNGFKDATTDAATIAAWEKRYPGCLWGMPTGEVSGLFVLDLDVNKTTGETLGESSLAALGIAIPPDTPCVRTPSGGRHYYFAQQPGLRSSSNKIGPKIDTRGEGGYVIIPPNGGYEWITHTDPVPVPLDLLREIDRFGLRPGAEPAPAVLVVAGDRAAVSLMDLDLLVTIELAENNIASRDDWFAVVNAVKFAVITSQPTAQAVFRQAIIDWSLRWPDAGPDAAKEAARAWDTAKPDGRVKAGTAMYLLRSMLPDGAAVSMCNVANSGPASFTHKPIDFSYTAADYAGKSPPSRLWSVKDWIPRSTVSLLSGPGGTGKSILALELAVATALGDTWMDMEATQGPVILVSAEDDKDELHRRLAAICVARKVSLGDLTSLRIVCLAGEDALLAVYSPKDGKLVESRLFNYLTKLCADTNPKLVVLDTLADLFGGNENDRAQARQFVGLLKRIAIDQKAAVVLLAHPSLSGISSGSGTSGSTAWDGSVRSRIYVSRIMESGEEANPDRRRISLKKSNYGRLGLEFEVEYQAGTFHRISDALQAINDRNAAAESVFLKMLAIYSSQGRDVGPSPGSRFAPMVFSKDKKSGNFTKRALEQAMNSLLDVGTIKLVDSDGPPSKSKKCIVRAEHRTASTSPTKPPCQPGAIGLRPPMQTPFELP